MKSPTLRNTAQKLGQIIHQSAYAEKMQAETVRQLLVQGYELGVHDELIQTNSGTNSRRVSDFTCGRCGSGWDFGEVHKCHK